MNTALGERLDAMAAEATTGLEMRHPSSPIVLDDYQQPRLRIATAAAAIVVAVFAGRWFSREPPSIIDIADAPFSEPLPALLYEELTPIEDLSPGLQAGFDSPRIRPLQDLSPDAPPIEFTGAHLVSRGDVTVAVGLDTTGQVLCVATTIDGEESSGSGCGTPASFALEGATSGSSSAGGRTVTEVFVADDVVAVEIGDEVVDVERNVGTAEVASPFPNGADGEIVDPVGGSVELGAIGCATTSAGVLAELAFAGLDGLVSAVVAPTGVWVNGSIGDTTINVVAPDAVVETTTVDGSLVIIATWETEDGQSRLQANCGTNHIDVTDLR